MFPYMVYFFKGIQELNMRRKAQKVRWHFIYGAHQSGIRFFDLQTTSEQNTPSGTLACAEHQEQLKTLLNKSNLSNRAGIFLMFLGDSSLFPVI